MERQLLELRFAYQAGLTDRRNLWQAVSNEGQKLRQFQSLINGSTVAAIEIEPDQLIVRFRSGLRMIWFPEDIRAATSIAIMEGNYEPAEYRFFTDLARDKKIVMDVGANIGWYSLNLAKMTAIPNVQIHAFEPVPSSYKQLLQNIALNRAQNQIVPHNIGLGSSGGEMVFYVPDFSGSTAASGRNLHPEETNERVKCQIRTADSFLMQESVPQVGLVKCDVEGAELLVLKGAKRLLEEDRPVFILELLRKWSRAFDYHPNDVLMLLRSYGYGCWAIGNERLRFLNEVTDETPEKNYIFLHEGHQVERNLIDPWLSSKPST